MNTDTIFFLDIGFVPVNKKLKVKGSGRETVKVQSLLIDPWLFKLPGFARIFHTHIFAPSCIQKTFLGEGYRLLSIDAIHRNVEGFFDDSLNADFEMLERRHDSHAPDRMTECSRKRVFMDHFLDMQHRDQTTLRDVQDNLYQPLPNDLPMDHFICIREYRFQQFLRYLVGLRFLAATLSCADVNLDLTFTLLQKMSSEVAAGTMTA